MHCIHTELTLYDKSTSAKGLATDLGAYVWIQAANRARHYASEATAEAGNRQRLGVMLRILQLHNVKRGTEAAPFSKYISVVDWAPYAEGAQQFR